jgi:hypothetical protein
VRDQGIEFPVHSNLSEVEIDVFACDDVAGNDGLDAATPLGRLRLPLYQVSNAGSSQRRL